MATLYEYYNTGDDGREGIYAAEWRAQTFTPVTAHTINFVKLKLLRSGSPGTITVSIRATDVSGLPTGADLCSGTIDGNTLTEDFYGAWYVINFGAGTSLSANTKYAIVLRAVNGDASNKFYYWFDLSTPTYAGGNSNYSSNSGVDWGPDPSVDLMFEDWEGSPFAARSQGFIF